MKSNILLMQFVLKWDVRGGATFSFTSNSQLSRSGFAHTKIASRDSRTPGGDKTRAKSGARVRKGLEARGRGLARAGPRREPGRDGAQERGRPRRSGLRERKGLGTERKGPEVERTEPAPEPSPTLADRQPRGLPVAGVSTPSPPSRPPRCPRSPSGQRAAV